MSYVSTKFPSCFKVPIQMERHQLRVHLPRDNHAHLHTGFSNQSQPPLEKSNFLPLDLRDQRKLSKQTRSTVVYRKPSTLCSPRIIHGDGFWPLCTCAKVSFCAKVHLCFFSRPRRAAAIERCLCSIIMSTLSIDAGVVAVPLLLHGSERAKNCVLEAGVGIGSKNL
jgi:hypothetical protein